jgi:hypothetical protein
MFQIDMNVNEPPSIIYPLVKEKYAWIDEYLQEKYYNNFDDKELLNEQYDYELVVNDELEEISLLKPTPITWANYKSRALLKGIEDEDKHDNEIFITDKYRKRAESDISNYEVNVGKVILNAYSNSLLDNHFIEEYFDYFEEVSTTNSSFSEESYYSYDSY